MPVPRFQIAKANRQTARLTGPVECGAVGDGEQVPGNDAMKPELPVPIGGFFQAHNSGRTENFLDLFAEDAVVADENHEYRGGAIRAWLEDAIAKFRPLHGEIRGLEVVDGRTVAIAEVSGSFPGSPVELRYRFALRDGKIAALNIGP